MARREQAVLHDVHFNLVPVPAGERIYGLWDFLAIQVCFGIAAWFFLVGSLTGLTVRAAEAVPIILFGNSIPLLMIAPMAVVFARYGVEQWLGSAAVLGHRFKDVWLLVYITSSFGWIAYASFLFGQSAIKFVDILWGRPGFLTKEVPGAILFAFVGTGIGVYLAYRGPDVLRWFARLSALVLLGVLGWFIWTVFSKFGGGAVFAAQPAEPLETLAWSRASAIEYNVGLGFSWAFWYGQWTRLSKSETAAFHGCLWGWGILAATAGIFSAFVALVLGTFDPTAWIVALGGTVVAILGLFLFAVANISSVATLVYPMAITLRSRFPRVGWLPAVLAVSLPALLLENPVVFERYGVYLAFIALLTGTYGGIMMADYFLVSRGRQAWSLRQLYNRSHGYRYVAGFNPAAVAATLAGAGFYLWTLNPLGWTSGNGWFPYITAGIPSFLVAFAVYGMLMRLWVLPAAARSAPEPEAAAPPVRRVAGAPG
jgi:NCS1 family nucleobase:cation symporter-1